MAKQPKKQQASKDQHQSGFLVRLPEVHREMLEQLKQKHRRPMTEEVRIALEKHYRDEGMKFPPDAST